MKWFLVLGVIIVTLLLFKDVGLSSLTVIGAFGLGAISAGIFWISILLEEKD